MNTSLIMMSQKWRGKATHFLMGIPQVNTEAGFHLFQYILPRFVLSVIQRGSAVWLTLLHWIALM